MDPIIAPSILSANFARLEDDIKAAERGGADYFHIDVMDGHFVPNISYGPIMARTMKTITDVPLDAHLMITNPDKYIPDFVDAGVDLIYPHIEAPYDVYRTVQLIDDLGAKPGITLNPGTPVETVIPLLDKLEAILLMSVCPGFGGQTFIPNTMNKIEKLRKILDEHKPKCRIAVDGGVSKDNIQYLQKKGTDFFVAGSAIFKAPDIELEVKEFRKLLKSPS